MNVEEEKKPELTTTHVHGAHLHGDATSETIQDVDVINGQIARQKVVKSLRQVRLTENGNITVGVRMRATKYQENL